jgi:hypothetical protein
VCDALPARRPLLQAYVEALAQAQRQPELHRDLARHMADLRAMVAERVAVSLDDGTKPSDPRCQAVASFVVAVCDGLAIQCLLDPGATPAGQDLVAGLAGVFAASFPAQSATVSGPSRR